MTIGDALLRSVPSYFRDEIDRLFQYVSGLGVRSIKEKQT